MIDLLVSQGRIADRAEHLLHGALLTARLIESKFNLTGTYVGVPSPACNDNWPESLLQASRTLSSLQLEVEQSLSNEKRLALVANTCSASLATLPVVARKYPDALLLWFDAHGDFNTPETTKSGYLGGMVVSAACGLWDSGYGAGINPQNVILIGARDIDPEERGNIEKLGARIIPPKMATPESIAALVGDSDVWVHIDWDVLEPGIIPADYSVPNGMYLEQIKSILNTLQCGKIKGIEVAEYNASQNSSQCQIALELLVDTISPFFTIK